MASGKLRFDAWEMLLVAAFVSASTWVLVRTDNPPQSAAEYTYFKTTYGPGHNTEREEEWMIRDFFLGRQNGYFVDVGANHYKDGNKTYYLETSQGWSGIAVEPQFEFAADWAKFRPRTHFFQLFVSDKSDEVAELYVLNSNRLVASSNSDFVGQFGRPNEVRRVPTITLNDLLSREGAKHIDFLSMDIELHEPEALQGFDIGRFHPDLVCVEGLAPVRQQILNYFAEHRYVSVGRYMWVDRENLYFMPLGATAPERH